MAGSTWDYLHRGYHNIVDAVYFRIHDFNRIFQERRERIQRNRLRQTPKQGELTRNERERLEAETAQQDRLAGKYLEKRTKGAFGSRYEHLREEPVAPTSAKQETAEKRRLEFQYTAEKQREERRIEEQERQRIRNEEIRLNEMRARERLLAEERRLRGKRR